MALKRLIKSHLAIIAFLVSFLNIMKQYFRDNGITSELAFSTAHGQVVMEKQSIQIEHAQSCKIQRDPNLQSSEVACVWTVDTHTKLILQPGMNPWSSKDRRHFHPPTPHPPVCGPFKIFAIELGLTEGQRLAKMRIPGGCFSDDWHASDCGLHQSHTAHCCPTAWWQAAWQTRPPVRPSICLCSRQDLPSLHFYLCSDSRDDTELIHWIKEKTLTLWITVLHLDNPPIRCRHQEANSVMFIFQHLKAS